MHTLFPTRSIHFLAVLAFLLFVVTACKKDDPTNALAACRQTDGGIGPHNYRDIMFWTAKDFGCGRPRFVQIRNTETGDMYSHQVVSSSIWKYYPTKPACRADGTITVQVPYGYEYEYTIACTGIEWKSKVIVDCSSDECVYVELK